MDGLHWRGRGQWRRRLRHRSLLCDEDTGGNTHAHMDMALSAPVPVGVMLFFSGSMFVRLYLLL